MELEKKLKKLNLEKRQAEDARDALYEKYALGKMDQKEYRKTADIKDGGQFQYLSRSKPAGKKSAS